MKFEGDSREWYLPISYGTYPITGHVPEAPKD